MHKTEKLYEKLQGSRATSGDNLSCEHKNEAGT